MPGLDILLGALEGGVDEFGKGKIRKKPSGGLRYLTEDDLAQENQKSDWMREVMKGIILQQMRPKGGDFDWEEFAGDDADMSGLFGADFLKRISGATKKKRSLGLSPLGGGGNPFGGDGAPSSGGVIEDF